MSSRQFHSRFNFRLPKARENFLSLYIFKKEKKIISIAPRCGRLVAADGAPSSGTCTNTALGAPQLLTRLYDHFTLVRKPSGTSCPTLSFYSSRDVLSSLQQNTRVELLPAALLNCCKGSGAGPRAETRDHNTQAPGSFLDDSAAGPHHHHCVRSTHGHSAHTLLQAQTVHCSAKHQIMWTGSMIWSSTF